MGEATLELYQREERRLAAKQARHGFRVHALATFAVIAALAVVNVFVAPQFPWSAIAAAGMLLGLWFHWYFAVHRGDELLLRHQDEVEREARELSAA